MPLSPRARPARRALTLLAALAAAAALSAAACKSDPWDDPARGDPFVPEPRIARRVGRLLEDASPRLVAADGGASVAGADSTLHLLSSARLGFGASATAHEEAVIETAPGDWPGSDGSRVVLSAGDGAPAGWPEGLLRRYVGGIACDDGSFLLHYAATRAGTVDEPALDYHGAGVVRVREDGAQTALRDGDWRFFGRGDPLFGMAVVQADHGITTGSDYVFGVRGDAGTDRVYVARVPHGRGGEREAYRFFTGGGDGPRDEWSDDVRAAAPLFRAGPHGLSVSWNAHLQAFLAVYSWSIPGAAGEPGRVRVLARASRRPEGPWSGETPLFEVRAVAPRGRVRPDAGAREHPELARDGGRVLFVSVDGSPAGSADRAGSAPRMWRVEFPIVR